MPDLITVANDLKNMPDQWLAQQMQSPSGTVPPWLVASEVQRRQKLRDGSARAQAPTSSVSQDLIKSLFAKIPPTAGLMPQGPGSAPPGMPPVNLTPPAGGMGSPPPGAPAPGMRMPPTPGMARGGRVKYATGSAVEDDEEYLAPTRDEEMSALYPEEEENIRPSAFGTRAAPARKQLHSVTPAEITQFVALAAKKYKIAPEVLGSLIRAESDGKTNAVSGKGARGIMQIMPDTAAWLGLKNMDQLDDPAVNIDLGAKYLRMQLDKYGDLKLALAAYNAGPGAVDKYKGVPPYRETQDYTAKILNNVNGVRKNLRLPPLTEPPPNMRSRLLQQGPPEAQGPQPAAQPPAPAPMQPAMAPVATPPPMAPPPPTVPPPTTAAAAPPPAMPMPPTPGPMATPAMPVPPAAGSPPENPEMRDWLARQDLAELPLSAGNTLSQPAMPPGAVPQRPAGPPTTAMAPRPGAPAVAPPPGAAAGMAAKPEPLHQVWEPPDESGPMKSVAEQMTAMQQGHTPLLERRAELYREQNLKMLDAAGQQFFGAPPDYSKYTKALDTVMALAQKNMHPSIGDSLMRWGAALSASKEHNFGVAAGQASAYTVAAMDKLKREGMRDYMDAAKAGIELQDKANQYNAKIGQYKMQRLGSQEAGLLQDERTYQTQLTGLQRQYMTLAGNYQKTLDVPREQALAGMAVLNELGIKYDKNLPGGPPAQVARDAPNRLNEVLMAGKNTRGAGAGGPSTTEKTQELRALAMLAERKDPWDPAKNPADQQFKTATEKLKAKYPVDAGKITVSASVMEPEDKKRAHAAAQAIYEGNQPPTLTGNSRLNPHIRQILQDDYHMNLSRAALEYGAVVKYQGSLNNPANINYQRNLAFVDNQIPIIQEKYDAWKQAISNVAPDFLTRFKGFNRRALEASMSMGGEIGKIANQLNTSVLELQTALPNIYSGGYAPHTEDLQKAEKMLKAEWDEQSFTGGLGLIGELTRARQNAQKLVRPQGVRSDSPYLKGINEAMGGGKPQERGEPWPSSFSQANVGKVYNHPERGLVEITGVKPDGSVRVRKVQ